ncbi:hypothetical protein NLG97_g2833 [Lecanicillium saksenae]|uniref:Uncharacterized protein n=1 Tax=Lecanicillium saksenae TaxID=468837 RepID=A0ACC1R110_9HYPO|nr:hypothetical protein NLG97_g2833 [Lecanicillium saksenae]
MAQTLRAPPSSFQPAEPSLGRRQKRQLNPILEEDSDDGQIDMPCQNPQIKTHAWFSPMSDHFPTPRGVNFLSAPILPSSPSTVSADSSPLTSSNPWNRISVATDSTEFDDLYDVSDEEDNMPRGLRRSMSFKKAQHSTEESSKFPERLIIPATDIEEWTAVDELKKITSPVPLTPSAQLPMSPAQLSFMGHQQALHIPSAPPSLDGSLTSEQLAAMSSPPTPVIGNDEVSREENWTGVRLQPGALATLHSLSSNDSESGDESSRPLEVTQMEVQSNMQMQQLPLRVMTDFVQPRPSTSNATRQSLLELSKLDIPSPGGFFSGLSPRSRNTWHPPSQSPAGMAPPTSTTAEQFYRCPWNIDSEVPPVPSRPDSAEGFYRISGFSSEPVEQVIEIHATEDDVEDDMPTARPILPTPKASEFNQVNVAPPSPDAEEVPTEIVVDYDPGYARKQQKAALSNFDRTELWLMAQRSYLKGVDEADTGALQTIAEDVDEEEGPEEKTQDAAESQKKVVRFSHILPTAQPKRLPSKLLRQESAYYRAFQDYIVRTQRSDVFVHQLPRFEALQGQRIGLRETHVNQLLGKYQLSVVPQSAKKRLSANVVRGDLNLTDDPEKIRKEKELEAMNQIAMPSWHVAALKFLNGGRLIRAPITKRLARISMASVGQDGKSRDKARILDLGGQATGDWAWHCALQYPNAKIYTVTTKAIRQLSNANIRGPPNHRQVAVQKLSHLPFPDNHFDLISARELHSILKFVGENGEDEWETCIRECMRVLKPDGYLEFSILDSDIMNAGPLGLAKSVEFGFSLKTLGYDPSPSKLWLRRLARAGFTDTRRAWVCLPMGAKRNVPKMPVASFDGNLDDATQVHQMEAMTMGSADSIASVCSIVGGWSWERWLLRCEMEKVAGELRLVDTVTAGETMREAAKCLEGVHDVMEEGRGCRAGFRMLNGYARKPKPDSGSIAIGFSG